MRLDSRLLVLLFAMAGCLPEMRPPANPDAGVNADDRCGPMPEVSYTCAAGVNPCTCVDHSDGTSVWHCDGCPPVDCAATPNDPVCVSDRACVDCHGLASKPGGAGIENAHPWCTLGCTTCHGGTGADPKDPARRLSKEEAHVPMPRAMATQGAVSTPSREAYRNRYLGRAGVETLPGGPEWIRFMNPGDLRVVDQTCAKAGCHEGAGEKVRRSTMSTLVGKFDAMLYAFGLPRHSALLGALSNDSFGKRLATYGALDVTDPTWSASTAPPGSVPGVKALATSDRETQKPLGTFSEEDILKETVNKLCGSCHLNNNGTNDKYGNFRSSGCSACHMPYDFSGRSASGDPMIPKDEPSYPAAYAHIQYPERPHPVKHQLQRVMQAKDCLACHTGSNRTVLQYWGIRTDDNRDLTRAKAAGANITFRYSNLINNKLEPEARLRGFSQDQLIEYEDLDGDGQDDTPPDVHFQAGLECIDCHTATDMHGDGRIYSRQNQAVQVRCVHCHGSLEYPADPDANTNPLNQLAKNGAKPDRKALWKFDKPPVFGEVGYPFVKVPGVWLRTKTKGEWKYVPQIRWAAQWDPQAQDCVSDGRRIDPRTGGMACSPTASIAHGRWQGLNGARNDFDDGVGPRPGVEVARGADGTTTNVRIGFSHLGEPTRAPNEVPVRGLECSACHATWHNMRFGNHMGLTDLDGNQRQYDWDRVTGETTLGKQGWFDFTFVDLLDVQLGINAYGNIAPLVPTRVKPFLRASVLNPATNTPLEIMQRFGDPSHAWKTYRDRVGFGDLVQGAQSGVTNAPGWAPICLEPMGFCDQDPKKNLNPGLGADTQSSHSIQKRPRDCGSCHLDEAGGGLARVSAVFGWNPQGFTKETSAYLNKIAQTVTPHGTYSTADGFTLSDDGVRHKLDWLVEETSGYPLVYSLHGRVDGGKGYSTYDPQAVGPITTTLIQALKRIRVRNIQQ
jgi:hypothetical protein